MKQVLACLSASKDRESSFQVSGSPLQDRLCAGKIWQSRSILPGGDVKLMQASLSAMEDQESSLYHCGDPVQLVQACLCV